MNSLSKRDENLKLFEDAIKEGSIEKVKQYLMPDVRSQYIDTEIGEGHAVRRPIFLACEYGKTHIARLLIENNCDMECESRNKWKSIHYASSCGKNKINCILDKTNKRIYHNETNYLSTLRLLIDNKCNIEWEDCYKQRPIHIACEYGNSEIVQLLIDNNCNIECEDCTKQRPIHVACEYGNTDIVQLLIAKNCNIECEDRNKRRPIHVACKYGNLDIVRLLIENDCNIECRTSENKSPLDIAKQNKKEDCVQFIQKYAKTSSEIKSLIERSQIEKLIAKCDSLTSDADRKNNIDWIVLQDVIHKNMEKIIMLMNERKMEDKELAILKTLSDMNKNDKIGQLIKEHILFRCIRDKHLGGFHKFSSVPVINGAHKIIESSFLEEAARFGNSIFIHELLKNTVFCKKIWSKTRELVLEHGDVNTANEIEDREFIVSSRLKRNLSLLHTAVIDNNAEMVRYLLKEKIVDPNINHHSFGTALALAHSLCHKRCITVLEEFNVDSNTQNKFCQTPLHEAIASGTHDQCQYLIKRSDNLDKEGFNNLTALHCAVMEGCADLCAQLTKYGADYARDVNIPQPKKIPGMQQIQTSFALTDRENSLTLCLKFNRSIYPCFLQTMNQYISNYQDGSNNSLLHLATLCLNPQLCELLLDNGASIETRNKNGNTPLLELLSYKIEPKENNVIGKIIDIANLLVKFSADINAVSEKGLRVFQLASNFDSEKLMITLLSKSPKTINLTENDFGLAFNRKWFKYLEMLMKSVSKDLISPFITREIVMKSFLSSSSSFIKLFFDKASEKVQQSVVEDILLTAAVNDDEDLFGYFIDKEIYVQKFFENGDHLLISLLREKRAKYFWKLSKSKHSRSYINLKNRFGQLPLQIAIDLNKIDIAEHLLLDTSDINSKDKNGETALMQLVKKISTCDDVNAERKLLKLIRVLIKEGGDINMKVCGEKTVIDLCSKTSLRSQIIDIDVLERKRYNTMKIDKKVTELKEVIEKTVVEKKICCVCLDREIECVFQCGHTFCLVCSDELFTCPLCNREITTRTKLFFT